jgi:predicted ATP-binding protein involved in virulence
MGRNLHSRPLTPLEQGSYDLVLREGWLPLTDWEPIAGGVERRFYRGAAERLYLLVASPVHDDDVAQIKDALKAELILGVHSKMVLSLGVEHNPGGPLDDLGIDVWTPAGVTARLTPQPEPAKAAPTVLRLCRLILQNYCAFPKLDLELPDTGPLVLVGANASGKSTILGAIATALSWLIARLRDERGRRKEISDLNIHNADNSASIQVKLGLGEHLPISWTLAAHRRGVPHKLESNLAGLRELSADLQKQLSENPTTSLPILAHYTVRRAIPGAPRRVGDNSTVANQLRGYDNAVWSEGNNSFRSFFAWFRHHEDLENEGRRASPSHRDTALAAVRRAIASVLGGYQNLRVLRSPQRMLIDKVNADGLREELHVDQLSDGEQCMLALVGDIAHRLALLNPGLEDPLRGGGIVLIDEIELHLHPAWQRMILDRLQETFPTIQWIITTHSPQILSHVPTENIRILSTETREFQIPKGAFGWDSNTILQFLMGVSERPRIYQDHLKAVETLLDEEQLSQAEERLNDLERTLGSYDPEIMRLRAVLNFLKD